MKGIKRRLSALLVIAAIAATYALPAMADNETKYTAVDANNVTFKKILVLKDDATTPNATFDFEVTVPANDIPAATGTLGVFKGVTNTVSSVVYPKIAQVTYAASDAADATDAVALTGNYKTVTKNIEMDFTNIKFSEPGVYRYYITEKNDSPIAGMKYGVTAAALTTEAEANRVRTLDIYVEDINAATSAATSGTTAAGLKITGYVLYAGSLNAGPAISTTTATSGDAITGDVAINTNGIFVGTNTTTSDATIVSGATKTNYILNYYGSNNLTFGKEVTGNQGSRDKYFKFTITANPDGTTPTVNASDKFVVDMTHATQSPTKTAATIYSAGDMEDANKLTNNLISGQDLIDGKDFYLQDGDYITIQGLPQGFKYTVAEDNEDYAKTEKIAAGVSSLDWDADNAGNDALNDNVSGTINNADIHTGFTNDKQGVIPTGVLVSMTPVIVIAVIVVAGIAFFVVRSAKKKAMELSEAESEEEAAE